ncbi:MAG: TerB family tellurite resistance protein [Pseudorhodobacter sp.]|nr:TerB family tellurite resistance protein [Pseudorhodobacter sp.]
MFAALLRRLAAPAPRRLPDPEVRLALAALLVRIGRSDNDYSPVEIARIDRVLVGRFELSPFEAAQLRARAELLEAEAPDTVRFTRSLKASVAHEDRVGLMQALWAVALADGARVAEEEQVLRLVANLLGLTDRESAQARHSVERGQA